MCCTPHPQHKGTPAGHGSSGCCCTPHGMFHPHSRKHKIKMLKKYLERLKEEVQDIEEYITELEKGQ